MGVKPMKRETVHGVGYQLVMLTAREATQEQRTRARQAIRAAFTQRDELLAALESLFEHCAMVHSKWGEDSNLDLANAAQAGARAAIAKARGGA
jgi:hypothetical protein